MSDLKRKSDLETTFTKGQLRKDLFFGDFFVYNAINGGSQIICVEKLFNDKESTLRDIEAKKKHILNKNEYLVNLLDYSVEVQSNWCSTFYLLKCFYEFVDRNLIGEILARKRLTGDKNRFKMEELTHLMYQQVNANAFLQERGICHGDISPNTLFISPKGDFKLAFRMNDMMSPERVQVDKAIKNEPLYLAPTFYEAVKQRTLDKMKHNQHKSDMFALGLTILQAGLMKPIQDIYMGDHFETRKLEEFLTEFDNAYEDNPLLFTSVRKMCEIDEGERPDFINLKSALPEYDVIKEYFQKVEAGIYEDEVPEEYAGANDSLKNYNPNYNYEGDSWTGQAPVGSDNGFQDHGRGPHSNNVQANPNQYGFQNSNNGQNNFSRSNSNKRSNSSNQGSQNNSFNKQGLFGNEFDKQYVPNNHNLKSTPHTTMDHTEDSRHQGNYQQGGVKQFASNTHNLQSTPHTNIDYSEDSRHQGNYQQGDQGNYQQGDHGNYQQGDHLQAETVDDFFSGDFFKYTPQTSVNSTYVSNTSQNPNQNQAQQQYSNKPYTPAPYHQSPPNYPQSVQVENKKEYQAPQADLNSEYYFPEVEESSPVYPPARKVSTPQIEPGYNSRQQNNSQSNQNNQNQYQSKAQTPDGHFFQATPYQNPSQTQAYTPSQRHQPQSSNNNPVPFTPQYNAPVDVFPERKNSNPASNGFTGQTKVFNGQLFNEIREEANVMENGAMVRKVTVKYVQADGQGSQSGQRLVSQPSTGYQATGYANGQYR